MKDEDCGCGKQAAMAQARQQARTHAHDVRTARDVGPGELHGKLADRGWTGRTMKDGKREITFWNRPSTARGYTFNDSLITVQDGDKVQLYRLSEVRPLDMILSGKAPPA